MKKIVLTLLTVITGVSMGFGSAHAYSTYHKGFTPYPTTVYAHSGLSTETKNAIYNACQQWNWAGAGAVVTKNINDHSTVQYPYKNSRNEITKGTRGTGADSYIMETSTLNNSSGYAVEADIDINVSYTWGNDGASFAYDVGNAMTHEVGHLLGLDENYSDTEVTMYYTAGPGETKKRTIEQDDKNGINFLY